MYIYPQIQHNIDSFVDIEPNTAAPKSGCKAGEVDVQKGEFTVKENICNFKCLHLSLLWFCESRFCHSAFRDKYSDFRGRKTLLCVEIKLTSAALANASFEISVSCTRKSSNKHFDLYIALIYFNNTQN